MKRIDKRVKRAATEILLLALVLLCCAGCRKKEEDGLKTLSLKENRTEKESTEVQPDEEQKEPNISDAEETAAEQETPDSIFIYVCGAVNAPGVYELDSGARIYEAIALAGGVREDAAEDFVNQAQKLTDGERIYIPTEEEAVSGNIALQIGSTDSPNASDRSTTGTDNKGKVNINTASEEELKTLNGIGDTRAKSIIEYREMHGDFRTIEDLMNVDGIKEGVFDKIRDSITVNTGS